MLYLWIYQDVWKLPGDNVLNVGRKRPNRMKMLIFKSCVPFHANLWIIEMVLMNMYSKNVMYDHRDDDA